MRLIDADKLLPILNETYDEAHAKYCELEFDSFWGGCCSMVQEVIREVEKQSTAYDADNVVEQLGELRKECEDPLQDYDPNYFIVKAIEIVKAGGNS